MRITVQMHIRDCPPADLARQITLLQVSLLKRIDIEELRIGTGRIEPFLVPNLANFLALHKYICHWCQYEVLRYAKDTERAIVLGHLVRTALLLRDLGNFDGLMAIVSRSDRTSYPSTE